MRIKTDTMNLKNLIKSEYEELLKFPAYISLLAANAEGKLDHAEEISAVGLAHIKSYSADPLLVDFFSKVDRHFKTTIESLNESLPLGKEDRENVIKSKLLNLEKIALKLGDEYSMILRKSKKLFKEYVSRVHHNVLIDFLFPIPIKGLSY